MSTEVYIVDGARTPIGTFGGSLPSFRPTELGALVMKEAIARSGLRPTDIENVVVGTVVPTQPKDAYVSRTAAVNAGIPIETPAMNIIVYSRKLLRVPRLESGADTPVTSIAPIRGAGGITITLAVAAPGQGPDLHAHRRTFETFTVLQGSFEFRWRVDPRDIVKLGQFDTISMPPVIYRALRISANRMRYCR